VYEKDAYKLDSRIFSLHIPILGICYGMQLIAFENGGEVAPAAQKEYGKARLNIIKNNALFHNIKQNSIVWMSHADKVKKLPKGFEILAKSENSEVCAFGDEERKIYAIQFHPEVIHSECGGDMLENFALRICQCKNDWNMKNFANNEIKKIRDIVLGERESMPSLQDSDSSAESNYKLGADSNDKSHKKIPKNHKINVDSESESNIFQTKGRRISPKSNTNPKPKKSAKNQTPSLEFKLNNSAKVLCAVSGGVDSSVVAALLYRAIGDNLIPVFVDTGLLRLGEREAVEKMFRENLKVPLISVDASEIFLKRLRGITEPEEKRKIIGETFIKVFSNEAKKHNENGEIRFLAQGTLYPDVIESISIKGPSKTIKSHHNVGGLPKWMKFKLIEPLRELFKDEVRALGQELGMPQSMLMRHPFPGPGLAIRIMGEVREADLAILRKADFIFIEELQKEGLYDSVWQAFCVLLNVRSVGVMGDNRTYDNTICLRAVEAQDGMSASFSHLPHSFLESVANRIINEVKGINRVVFDITSKPPGTIEWE